MLKGSKRSSEQIFRWGARCSSDAIRMSLKKTHNSLESDILNIFFTTPYFPSNLRIRHRYHWTQLALCKPNYKNVSIFQNPVKGRKFFYRFKTSFYQEISFITCLTDNFRRERPYTWIELFTLSCVLKVKAITSPQKSNTCGDTPPSPRYREHSVQK